MSGAEVRFVASLAAVMHPIKSGRDGARITIDVPLSERLEVMKLELMTDMAFEVTIRPVVTKKAADKAPALGIKGSGTRKRSTKTPKP